MYLVTKLFRISMGHRLKKHLGRCFNVHGHNERIEVTLQSEKLNSNDMVIDFSDLKDIIESIIDKFDHTTIANPTDHKLLGYLKENNMRVEIISEGNIDPTAEVMCKYLYNKINDCLQNNEIGIKVSNVVIWENDNSKSEYRE